jgi:sugar phosphate isomerase/epimerase
MFGMPDDALDALFARDNLAAWCIVPYDGARRGPVERAELLSELGFTHFVWDWREEHLVTFEAELDALAVEGIALDGIWFPTQLGSEELDEAGRFLLEELARREVSTDLWVCTEFGEPEPQPQLAPSDQVERVELHARAIAPAAQAARSIGGRVGLYNHLGWFGEPQNQLDVARRLEELGFDNVGLVYNQHHGHAHVSRFSELLSLIRERLIAVNLNGTVPDGDLTGRKILPVGHGELDGELLAALAASGWRGRVGIIGHTADDARDRLLDNLEGLDWLVSRLRHGEVSEVAPEARVPRPVLPGW